MCVRVAINGFGRIGRNVFRTSVLEPPGTNGPDWGNQDVKIVAINDLADADTLNYLLTYDSVHGRFHGHEPTRNGLRIPGQDGEVEFFSERDPANLPWQELGVDVVVESTGVFRSRKLAAKHLEAGAKKVIIGAPVADADLTVVLGVNHESIRLEHEVISNASCTTNCLAPVAKVLCKQFGWVRGLMTTVHSYTSGQVILDAPHKDLRRGRSAAVSMIPTTTGAARATGLVLPEVKDKLDGMAIRVPTPNVSLVDLVAELENDVTPEEVNDAFRAEAQRQQEDGPFSVLSCVDDPVVSADLNGTHFSSIVDTRCTSVMDGKMVKVLAWYDNERAYSCRIVDLAGHLFRHLPSTSD